MKRDIDTIIEQVKEKLPLADVWQHWVKNPSVDDDGVWFFSLPDVEKNIQIESSFGTCPFMVEHDDMTSTSEAHTAQTVEEAVGMIVSFLERQHASESEEAFGTIVGVDAGCVVVELDNGDEILCRSVKRMHRPLGFFTVPVGKRVRVRLHPVAKNKRPLILEVLDA
jgi:hypothetical protein